MPDFMLSRMVLSADKLNADVRPEDDLTRLSKYDAVLVFGMGLKWTEDDRDIIRALDEKGVKYTTMMVTTPENNLTNNHGGQADHDSTNTHSHISKTIILGYYSTT